MSTIINPTTMPVTYTDDARVIGAGERLPDVDLDATGQSAIARGDLAEIEDEQDATEQDEPSASDTTPEQDQSEDSASGAPVGEHAS